MKNILELAKKMFSNDDCYCALVAGMLLGLGVSNLSELPLYLVAIPVVWWVIKE